jgi:hypothetical protein
MVATSDEVTPELIDEVSGLVTEAGAKVGGVVRLQPEFSDPATESALQSYVTSPGIPAGVKLPETEDAGQLVGSLLAQTLMIPKTAGADAPKAEDVSSVLAGLSALDVLTVEGSSVEPADYTVVLTGTGFDADAAARNQSLVELVSALDAGGSGAVVAGTATAARDNGLVGTVRADPKLSAAISTVDNVDRASGRISTVLALGQEAKGTSGMYGTGEDTQPVPPVPDAVPAP